MVERSTVSHDKMWNDIRAARDVHVEKHPGLKCSKNGVSMKISEQLDSFSNVSQNLLLNMSAEKFETGGKLFLFYTYCSDYIEQYKEKLIKIVSAGPFSKSLMTALKVNQKWSPSKPFKKYGRNNIDEIAKISNNKGTNQMPN